MPRVTLTCLALALFLALAAPPAGAGTFRLDPARSSITFTYLENGEPRTGRFARLAGQALFDPAALAEADVTLVVASTGVDLGDPLRSHFARSADWFDAETFPDFTVRLRRLTETGPGRYRAEGVVAIKGHEVAIAPEVTVLPEDGGLRATGEMRLNRHDYRLGIGFSALFATIGTEVVVRFDLAGRPVP